MLAFGVIDILNYRHNDNDLVKISTIPFQMGLEQCLYVALAIFLTHYGAGVAAIRSSLKRGLCWGIFSGFLFFLIIGLTVNYGNILGITTHPENSDAAFGLFMLYMSMLLAFYLVLAFSPTRILYRRPACYFYAKYNLVFNGFLILISIIFEAGYHDRIFNCGAGFVMIAFSALFQPAAIYYTLQLDSQVC